jgi:hypothetical protein
VNGEEVFAPLANFPGAESARPIGPPIRGAQQWAAIPGKVLYDRIADIRTYLQQAIPGRDGAQFVTVFPQGQLGQQFASRENNFALYGQINYGFKLGFPIDGTIGLRYVNNFGTIRSTATERIRRTVNGQIVENDVNRAAFARGNFVDLALRDCDCSFHWQNANASILHDECPARGLRNVESILLHQPE